MHCRKHSVFHATCPDCKRKTRQSESNLSSSYSGDSLLTNIAMTTAVESIFDSGSSVADSTGDSSSGFDASTNSGGDFGGGGAGGD